MFLEAAAMHRQKPMRIFFDEREALSWPKEP